jgi:hypothetical protein
MENSEIVYEAHELVREFGSEAKLLAEIRAKRAICKQDARTFHFWNRVADNINDLQRRNQTQTPA